MAIFFSAEKLPKRSRTCLVLAIKIIALHWGCLSLIFNSLEGTHTHTNQIQTRIPTSNTSKYASRLNRGGALLV